MRSSVWSFASQALSTPGRQLISGVDHSGILTARPIYPVFISFTIARRGPLSYRAMSGPAVHPAKAERASRVVKKTPGERAPARPSSR
jgi:hypothetical protein